MLVGSEGVGGVDFDDAELTRTLGTIGLILILFEGGLTAGWREIRPVLATAISLGTVGTILTAVIGGFAAAWMLDLGNARGPDHRLGDRRDRLRRDLRRAARVEPAAQDRALAGGRVRDERPGRAAAGDGVHRLDRGAGLRPPRHGLRAGRQARARGACSGSRSASGRAGPSAASTTRPRASTPSPRSRRPRSPTASPRSPHGSGFLAVYLTALILGSGAVPGKRTIIAFHQGLGWVAQISLFFLLGLLVFPSELIDVAGDGLLLSAVLIFVARPLAPTRR